MQALRKNQVANVAANSNRIPLSVPANLGPTDMYALAKMKPSDMPPGAASAKDGICASRVLLSDTSATAALNISKETASLSRLSP
jgi:hypothetical protein